MKMLICRAFFLLLTGFIMMQSLQAQVNYKSYPSQFLRDIQGTASTLPPALKNRIKQRPPNITGTSVPYIEWQKCFGSSYGEYAKTIQTTPDGGFIMAGNTDGTDNGDVMGHHSGHTLLDIWILKLDKSGKIEWQKSLGGMDQEMGADILLTPDGGYIVTGSTASSDCAFNNGHGIYDYYVVKLSSSGDVQWQKTYGGSEEDVAFSIALAKDGGYFVAGYTYSLNGDITSAHGRNDYWVIKIDGSGTLIWQKALGGSGEDIAYSIQGTTDGGCVVAGITFSNDGDITGQHGSTDAWIVKLSISGTIQWQKAIGGTLGEIASCVQLTTDDGYIVSGYTNSDDGDISGYHPFGFDCMVIKIDAQGSILWQHCYGGSGNESGPYVQLTADGGYVIAGISMSADGDINCNAGIHDAMVFKINATGTLEWTKTFGGSNFDEATCVQPLADGSFIVAGNTVSPDIKGFHTPAIGAGDISDYWVVKLSPPLAAEPAPVVTINPKAGAVCLTKASFRADVLYGGVNPVYQWTRNGVAAGTNSNVYTDVNFSGNDKISCTVTKSGACENSSLKGIAEVTVTATNAPRPAISIITDNISLCPCTSTTIRALVTNGGSEPVYKWKINGQPTLYTYPEITIAALNEGDIVTCVYSDNTLCAGIDSIISNTITFKSSNTISPAVTITTASNTVCRGSAIKFIATATDAGENPVYQWQVNNINQGTNSSEFISTGIATNDVVSCVVKPDPFFKCAPNISASSNKIVMTVTQSYTPSIKISTGTSSICKGLPASFTATAPDAGANPSYQWKINGINTGTNSPVFVAANFNDGDTVTCTLDPDPALTCAVHSRVVSEPIVMNVFSGALPGINIAATNNNTCAGETISFTATATNAGTNPTFNWVLNNTKLAEQSPLFKSNKLANGDRLFCTLIPGQGACASTSDTSQIISAIVKDTPLIKLLPADTVIRPNTQVLLRSITSGDVASFTWSPANKMVDPLALTGLTTQLNETTAYQLQVVNDNGCKATATSVLKIFSTLFMPSAFSPDGDGVNDVFRIPPLISVTLREFSVYNRWGQKIFATTRLNEGWDGTLNGTKQNARTYIYIIKSSINGKESLTKGSFILMR